MLVDLLSHRDHRPLHLIKFNVGQVTDTIISADARKQTYLTTNISSYNQEKRERVGEMTNFLAICFPTDVQYKKHP